MADANKKPPLLGVRVIDFGGAIAGPLATMLLTDQGAETIRIENPGCNTTDDPMHAVLDRGKQRVALDIKSSDGLDTLHGLLADADIFIENYAPGVMDRLGLNSEKLRERYPALITVSLPGFRAGDNTFANTKCYEGILAAMTGQFTDIHLMRRLFGLNPVYTALPLASVYSAVHAATAAVIGLRARNAGQPAPHIETPLAGAALSAMSSMYMRIENQPERYDPPRLPGPLKNIVLPFIRRIVRFISDTHKQKLLGIARKSYPALMTS